MVRVWLEAMRFLTRAVSSASWASGLLLGMAGTPTGDGMDAPDESAVWVWVGMGVEEEEEKLATVSLGSMSRPFGTGEQLSGHRVSLLSANL